MPLPPDCCPRGWVLHRSKCLYISVTNKTWQESHQDCSGRSAGLLVPDSSPSFIVPVQSRKIVVAKEGGAGQSPAGPAAAVPVEVPRWHPVPGVPILAV